MRFHMLHSYHALLAYGIGMDERYTVCGVGARPACGTNAYWQTRQAYLQCVTWRAFICTRGEIGKRRRLKSGLPARVAGSSPAGCTIALCAYFLGVVAER